MRRSRFFQVLGVAVLISMIGAAALPLLAQGGITLEVISNLNVRSGPGAEFMTLTTVPRGVNVVVEGRNRYGDWVLVHSEDGAARGWVASRYLIWGSNDVALVAEVEEIIGSGSAPVVVDSQVPAAQSRNALQLFQGPNSNYPVLASLPRRTAVNIEARNGDGLYLLVNTNDGQRGWAITSVVNPDVDLSSLPVSEEVISGAAIFDEILARLDATPILPTITNRARAIYRTGRSMGMRPNVFSKVGDCHTEHLAFLVPIGAGEYTLGDYGGLQSTIDFFSVSPRDGVTNSFVNESMAAASAFSAAAVLDTVWADPAHCLANEAPLLCDLRILRPSVALIMFGSVDAQIYGVNDYGYYLRRVVQETIRRGVVPVLFTFPSNPNYNWEKSLAMNAVVLDIAEEEDLPVVNLWKALRPLPNGGLQDDNFHLSFSGDRWMNFTGDQNSWGMVQYNLIALQTLQVLQQNLLR